MWFGSFVTKKQGFALVGCTVSPGIFIFFSFLFLFFFFSFFFIFSSENSPLLGFDFEDFEMAKREEILPHFDQKDHDFMIEMTIPSEVPIPEESHTS